MLEERPARPLSKKKDRVRCDQKQQGAPHHPPLRNRTAPRGSSSSSMAEETADEASNMEALKRTMQYALIKNCDMIEEMRSDAVDLVISATEKYPANYELAARMIKEQMDKKYNENWIVVIGQGFAFEVTHEVKMGLWMYFCDIAVLVCKAGARQVGT